jgi:transcriptional regulator CtsR
MILRNTADSLSSCDSKEFLYSLVEKEFITDEEKKAMDRILNQAALQISSEMNKGA